MAQFCSFQSNFKKEEEERLELGPYHPYHTWRHPLLCVECVTEILDKASCHSGAMRDQLALVPGTCPLFY